MKLIVTRPAEDAGRLGERLAELGYTPIFIPLLEILQVANPVIPDRPWQGIFLTSANAVRGMRARNTLAAIPVFTVGPQSAEAARKAGFTKVTIGGTDVATLARFASHDLQRENGPLLYLSGETISGDLAGTLGKAGFDVQRIVTYVARPLTHSDLDQRLSGATGVLLYSPRTAHIWAESTAKLDMSQMIHYCLSENVAKALPGSAQVRIAVQSTDDGMMSLLARNA